MPSMSDQSIIAEPQESLRLRGSRHQHQNRHNNHHHRRLEDVDYWRKSAGWADDDEAMKSYNQGVYNTYYMGDDVSGGTNSGGMSGSKASRRVLDHTGWILGLASTIIFLIMLVKCCSSAPSQSVQKRTSSVKSSRDSSRSIRDKHGERRSRSRSRAASGRSRSKSRTRSKSKSRSSGGGGGDANTKSGSKAGSASSSSDYKLMDDDDDDNKSRRSTRSSRSGRSRSRSKVRSSGESTRSRSSSKARSKSKSRNRDGEKTEKKEQKMLV